MLVHSALHELTCIANIYENIFLDEKHIRMDYIYLHFQDKNVTIQILLHRSDIINTVNIITMILPIFK